MKNYVQPIVNLLYLNDEDVIRTSPANDPALDDGFNDDKVAEEGGEE